MGTCSSATDVVQPSTNRPLDKFNEFKQLTGEKAIFWDFKDSETI